MKEIQLSKQGKNRGRYVALVDDEHFEELNKFNWSLQSGCNTHYAARTFINTEGKRILQFMHVYLMGKKGIDHADHDGLNNQKYNLRDCTQQQNTMNTTHRKNTTSKYKGVCVFKRDKKYYSIITFNQKPIFLGSFVDEIEAAKAYNTKAIELFGEFACLNEV